MNALLQPERAQAVSRWRGRERWSPGNEAAFLGCSKWFLGKCMYMFFLFFKGECLIILFEMNVFFG